MCRITWWTGNPSVNEGIPGVKFDLTTSELRREAVASSRVVYESGLIMRRGVS
jgi:hypothetical protein